MSWTWTLAFHPPCSLQHGQQIIGLAESILVAAGFELTPVADAHLCCGSAGTYSILQPELAQKLKAQKLASLHAGSPQEIVSANIACLGHLQSGTELPLRHWIVALDKRLSALILRAFGSRHSMDAWKGAPILVLRLVNGI